MNFFKTNRAIFLKEKEHRKEIEKQNEALQQQLEDYKFKVLQSQEGSTFS